MLCLLLLAALVITPVAAQATAWFAYLYNPQSKALVRVGLDGGQSTYSLDLGADIFIGGYDTAFTADGGRLAFCALKNVPADNPTHSEAIVFLRDIAAQKNLLEINLGKAVACRTGQTGYSPDGAQIAVSIVAYVPFGQQAAQSGPVWRLLTLDAASGQIVKEINAQSAAIANVTEPKNAVFPFVRYFSSDLLVFMFMPFASEGSFDAPAYTWQPSSGAVQTINYWGKAGLDSLGGELSWVALDAKLPAVMPEGPIPQSNTVMIADKTGQARMIYHNGQFVVADTRFINDGQQLAIFLLPGFDLSQPQPEQPVQKPSKWIALDRAGNLTELHSTLYFTFLRAAPGGYVMLDLSFKDKQQTQAQTQLKLTRGGLTSVLWTSDSQGWELAWAAPAPAAANLPPFPTLSVK
jgi:hypothetical protein